MTVFRTFDICMVAVMIGAAAITYKVKYDAQKRIGEVRRIERQITAEKNMVHLLYAEWALVTEPNRLQVLAERYQQQLGLEIINPRQVVNFKDIPERRPDQIQNIIKDNPVEEINNILAQEEIKGENNSTKNNILNFSDIDQLITASMKNKDNNKWVQNRAENAQ